jgi:predicted HTH transcriptional regulator
VLLAALGLNTFNLFSFENFYNRNVTKYFQTVGDFGDYFEQLLPKALTPATALQPHHQVILDIIKEKGFVADRDYAARTTRAKASRTLDFQKLVDLGMIERRGQKRGSYYVLAANK